MIYAVFCLYLLGILFAGMGVYRLWAGMVTPRWVNWALLPGTVVSEMAYIFGCLITGGEVRRAKLMDAGPETSQRRRAAQARDAQAEPTTEAAPRLRYAGPVIAAFVTVSACGAGIVIAHALLGGPVIGEFVAGGGGMLSPVELPRELPAAAGAFWDQVILHVRLLRRMAGTWVELDWLNWRVPLFVYLATCLSIRLAPVRRSLRATLAAVIALGGIIAVLGAAWTRFEGLMGDIWPLVTYVWSSLLLLLAVSLVIRGAVALAQALVKGQP